MASVPQYTLTPEQYLTIERAAERKSEYYYGEMFAMAGNTREHVVIVTNLSREPRIEWFTRQPDNHWVVGESLGVGGHLTLPSIDATVAMSEIYSRVTFSVPTHSSPLAS